RLIPTLLLLGRTVNPDHLAYRCLARSHPARRRLARTLASCGRVVGNDVDYRHIHDNAISQTGDVTSTGHVSPGSRTRSRPHAAATKKVPGPQLVGSKPTLDRFSLMPDHSLDLAMI